MKAVLISIRPKWCEMIATGKKTVEVRKTRPKLHAPFKCYIYCTKAPKGWFWLDSPNVRRDGVVIGEFVCNEIECFTADYRMDRHQTERIARESGMSMVALEEYECDSPCLYGWHISDLKIYDRPKELSEFWFPPETYCEKGLCGGCPYDCIPSEYGDVMYDCEWKRPIKRAPQSWCYVDG